MAITTRADLVIPEVLQDAIRSEFAGAKALSGSSAAVINGSLPTDARGGDRLKVPYFGNIGEFDTLTNETDALTPRKITMSSEEAVVKHSGIAIELTDWAKMAAAFADPYAEMARQIRVGFERLIDQSLLDAATASLSSSMVLDKYSATLERKIDYDLIVDGKMLWGDEQDDIVLLAHHSKVFGDLLKLKTGDGAPLLTPPSDASVGRFVGIPLKTSDRNTVTTDSPKKYSTLLMKRGSVICWYNGQPTVETDRDILTPSTVAAVHVWWIAHRYANVFGGTKPGVVKILHNASA